MLQLSAVGKDANDQGTLEIDKQQLTSRWMYAKNVSGVPANDAGCWGCEHVEAASLRHSSPRSQDLHSLHTPNKAP